MERWEVLLRALNDQLSTPNEVHPTVRCWKHWWLSGEIADVVKAKRSELLTTFPPASEVINHLKRIGLVQPIKAQGPGGKKSVEFLLMDTGSEEGSPISPMELLQAWLPAGTICYFSALAYYELTTQPATHHHIARLDPHRPGGEPTEDTRA